MTVRHKPGETDAVDPESNHGDWNLRGVKSDWHPQTIVEHSVGTQQGRGQANMLSIAVAFLLLTGATGAALGVAHGSLASAERDVTQRALATDLADRLVAPDTDHVHRKNVLDRNKTESLSTDEAESLVSDLENREFRVRIDDSTLMQQGNPAGGPTVERLVLLASPETRSYQLHLEADEAIALPRRTEAIEFRIESGPNTTVTTIRANDRIVLHAPEGLAGTATVAVPWTATQRITIDATGSNATVDLRIRPKTTVKARLEVTVGDVL